MDKNEIIEKLLEGEKIKDKFSLNDFLTDVTKRIIESIAKGELTDFLKYKEYDYSSKKNSAQSANSRNGFSKKKVKIPSGEVVINVPRDRKSIFSPYIVKKHQKDVASFDDRIIAM